MDEYCQKVPDILLKIEKTVIDFQPFLLTHTHTHTHTHAQLRTPAHFVPLI